MKESTTISERRGYERYFTLNSANNVTLKDDAPEELRYFILRVHNAFDVLPNDWIYMIIANAFEELAGEGYCVDDITIEADCNYSDLYRWAGEPFAHICMSDYLEQMGEVKGFYEMIAAGQWLAKDRIYRMVCEFILEEEALDEAE